MPVSNLLGGDAGAADSIRRKSGKWAQGGEEASHCRGGGRGTEATSIKGLTSQEELRGAGSPGKLQFKKGTKGFSQGWGKLRNPQR